MRIGEVAKIAGINKETIRYYEKQGLIETPVKSSNGYRTYTKDTVSTIKFVKNAQKLGFSLKEIKNLLSLKLDADSDCSLVKKRAEEKIIEIQLKITALKEMKRSLTEITNKCDGHGSTASCNIINALDSKEL